MSILGSLVLPLLRINLSPPRARTSPLFVYRIHPALQGALTCMEVGTRKVCLTPSAVASYPAYLQSEQPVEQPVHSIMRLPLQTTPDVHPEASSGQVSEGEGCSGRPRDPKDRRRDRGWMTGRATWVSRFH